ncbi:MAG: hypothetical protein JW888_00800 [Pirellulales bacterium]|nr:hypothetical protein [Pirellulales bacterium]
MKSFIKSFVPTLPWRRLATAALGLSFIAICVLPVTTGCRNDQNAEDDLAATDTSGEWRERCFSFAVDNLQRLEQFAGDQMRQKVIDRLNQWAQYEKRPADWEIDPLVATLPKPLVEMPEVRSLGDMTFLPYDGYALQEAVWLRDLSNWARGPEHANLARAESLFDWTIRNIQLAPGTGREPDRIAQQPWETLLWGKGTAVDRAWVFVLLLRQQGIDAVLLGLPGADKADGENLDVWAVGVLIDGQLHLFDPALGLPIPGPKGVKYEKNRLIIPPATLSEVVKDPALLRNLDIEGHRYPVDAERLAGVVAMVEASPAYLAARMKSVESRLVGDQQVVLTSDPSALVDRLKGVAGLADCRLWTWPYEVLLRSGQLTKEQRRQLDLIRAPFQVGRDTYLWKGRVLHLKGVFSGVHNATYCYQQARPSKRNLAMIKREIAETVNPQEIAQKRGILDALTRGKGDATYWLGLVALAQEKPQPEVAVDYFRMESLIGAWAQGARYNLGRIAEEAGLPNDAAVFYRTAPAGPDTHGNLLRARWLVPPQQEIALPGVEETAEPEKEKSETPKPETEKPE